MNGGGTSGGGGGRGSLPPGGSGAWRASVPPAETGASRAPSVPPRGSVPPGGSMPPRASNAPLKLAKVVGTALDAVVRSVRTGMEQSQRSAARRLADAWAQAPEAELEIRPTQATFQGEIALEANENDGRWLLPAFMAGVRSIRPRADMTLDDAVRLGEELSGLEPEIASVARFHDWVWGDGAEGFQLALQPSFMEAMEALVEDERIARLGPIALRQDALAPMGEAVRVATRDLDEAAVRAELEMPLEAHERRLRGEGYGLGPDELAALKAGVEDANAWTAVEIEAVLAYPRLREMVPPARLARRLLARLTQGVDSRFLALVAKLHEDPDPYRRAIAAALQTQDLGALIARGLVLTDGRALRSVSDILARAEGTMASALARGLLERASREPPALEAFAWMAKSIGFGKLRRWFELATLPGQELRVLFDLARRSGEPAAALEAVLDEVPVPVAAAALEGLSSGDLAALAGAFRRLAARAKSGEHEALVKLVASSPFPDGLRVVGEMVLAAHGQGIGGRWLYALLGALAAHGLAKSFVVPLARSASAQPDVRLIALDCLAQRPDLLAEAAKWRLAEMLDPPEVRERLRAIRGG